jgi:peptide/nickel transport system ATP-binding protein
MKPCLIADNISYRVESKEILSSISFAVNEKEIIGIAGESGSGKTTLGKICAGIISPSSGKVILNVVKKGRSSPVQFLFQNNGEVLNPLRKCWDMVYEVVKINSGKKSIAASQYPAFQQATSNEMKGSYSKARRHEGRFKTPGSISHRQTEEILHSVNLDENLWHRRAYELSGGEQQRGALARVLAANPDILILDEPFSAQDPDSQVRILELFKKINNDLGKTILCISHDLLLLRQLCTRIIIMYKGKIVEEGKTEEVLQHPKHEYTKFLLRAESYQLKYEDFVLLNNKLL